MQTMTVFTVAAVMFSRSALNLSRFLGKKNALEEKLITVSF